MSEKVKHILIDFLIVFVVPIFLFYMYSVYADDGSDAGETPGEELAGKGQEYLIKLTSLKALTLDTSVFQTPTYQSLVDSTVVPPTEEKGRLVPFVPPQAPAPAKGTTPSKK